MLLLEVVLDQGLEVGDASLGLAMVEAALDKVMGVGDALLLD